MSMPVTEGAVIAIEYAINMTRVAIESNQSLEWLLEKFEESHKSYKKTIDEEKK